MMNYESSSFREKYKQERVLAVLGRRKATCSRLKLSLVEWGDRQNTLDIRIWYDGADYMDDTPGKGIMFSEREGLALLHGLLEYYRGIVSDIEARHPCPDGPETEEQGPLLQSVSSL